MRTIIGSTASRFPSSGYFRCDEAKYSWSEYNVANWNLICTQQGLGWARFDPSGDVALRAASLALVPPRRPRSYSVDPSVGFWEHYWVHFDPGSIDLRGLPFFEAPDIQVISLADSRQRTRIAGSFRELHSLNLKSLETTVSARLKAHLLEDVLLRVAETDVGSTVIDDRIARCLDYIHNHIRRAISIDDLASESGMSASHFHARFKEEVGSAPVQYIESRRIELACFYLRSTRASVAQVADQTGYQDAFYFSTRFKRATGQSPSAFRKG